MKPLNVADYRLLAKKRLPKGMFEYIDRGTEDEVALKFIRKILDETKLRQKLLNDVHAPDMSAIIFGEQLSMPVIISPTAVAGLLWHDGEVQLARAARAAGIPFCIATQSMTSMEEIVDRATGANLWFQLYVFEDRDLTRQLIDRAKKLGIKNLLFTADTPRSPKKEWNVRNGFGIPIRPTVPGALDLICHPKWSISVMLRYLVTSGIPTYAHYPPEFRSKITQGGIRNNVRLARKLTWDDFAETRRLWDGNLMLKGVLDRQDAERALSAGADGIVVSCHGGRNMDSAPTALQVLPEIADAVGHKLTILADSGIRRGSDIVKCLAAGAQAVLVGRAPLYGAAVAGERGAIDILKILREELDHCMAFTGQARISDIDRKLTWQ
jgi:isopentenyl diphosphate isomerase/L-lactate dehydrogenase-like FMN-dependent dehydrogenase